MRLETRVYRIPTDRPEADGTFRWEATTMLVVEAVAATPGEHYEVSIKAGERVLLPAVRAAAPDTLIVANGFSCREQIAQTTDRRALHLAEVIQLGLRAGNPQREASSGRRATPAS